jgi:hypothetical protein
LVVLLLLPAAKPALFVWFPESESHDRVVEQQTPGGALADCALVQCVVNPTDPFCVWDADESIETRGTGWLQPGESTTWTSCVIADWVNHLVYVTGAAGRHGQITATITADNPHLSGSVTVSGPEVAACLFPSEYDRNTPLLSEIPESNGGVGQYTPVTVTITNIGARRTDASVSVGIRAAYQISWIELYCGPIEDIQCDAIIVAGLGSDPKVCWGVH